MFMRLGSFVYKARWAVISFWVVLIIVAGIFAPKATEILKAGGFNLPNAESIKVVDELVTKFGSARNFVYAVFTAPDGTRADDPAYAKQVDTAVSGLRGANNVTQVVTFASSGAKDFVSENGKYTYALIGVDLNIDEAQQKVGEIESKIKPGNLDMKLTGLPVIYEAVSSVSQHDVEKAELFTFPIALIILLLVFRTVVAATMPLMMALVSVLLTLGAVYFIGQAMDVSIFVLNICTILGLGLGIDYALFIVGRFREELYKQKGDAEGAVRVTISTAGKAVFVSGLTVAIGLGSLLLFQFTMLKSIGIGGVLVVGISVLAALTLLPAVLGVLGQKINSWKIPGLKPVEQRLAQQSANNGFWHKLAERVSKNPILVAIPVLAFLLLLGSPFLHIRFGEPTYQILPPSEPARQGAEILDKNFPTYGKSSDIYLIIKSKDGKMTDKANAEAMYDYATSLKTKFPEVQQVTAVGQNILALPKAQVVQLLTTYGATPQLLSPQFQEFAKQIVKGDTATLKVLTSIEYSSQAANDFVKAFRAYQPATLSVAVGGEQPGLQDFVDVLFADFPIAILVVVVVTYIVLFLMFQSVILPIKAVIMTGLSLSASYGAMVWIFQDGNLLNIIGGQNLGYVEATLPVLLFAILFGLSMDYEVFMLSRIKETYDETGDNRKAVAIGLERTGGVITSAALLMVVVAGAFVSADIVVVKAIGLGMALAVALDATIVRALLVPATMELLGKANWWAPRFVTRWMPKFSVE